MPELSFAQLKSELKKDRYPGLIAAHGSETYFFEKICRLLEDEFYPEKTGLSGVFSPIEKWDAGDTDADSLIDASQTFSFGATTKLIFVRHAEELKQPEKLATLFSNPLSKQDTAFVMVLHFKALDLRKKFSKQLLEKAACVSCAEVSERERSFYLEELLKEKSLTLSEGELASCLTFEPWNLISLSTELDRLSLEKQNSEEKEKTTQKMKTSFSQETFLDAFFKKERKKTLVHLNELAHHPEEALPLLGSLTWNTRQLSLLVSQDKTRNRNLRLPPFLVSRFEKWKTHWKLEELLALQKKLSQVDFDTKQTPKDALGVWGSLL